MHPIFIPEDEEEDLEKCNVRFYIVSIVDSNVGTYDGRDE